MPAVGAVRMVTKIEQKDHAHRPVNVPKHAYDFRVIHEVDLGTQGPQCVSTECYKGTPGHP